MTIKIYEVGGAVRDSFRGVSSKDIDYAVEAPSYNDMKDYVLSLGASIFIEHPEFVTIRAKWNGNPCDFTLCRKEREYKDNRHPSIVEPGTIHDDLARRDFTINAIARNCMDGKILDPFGGIEDIKNKIIRTVGSSDERFQEDALRIMRALRFQTVLGFEISHFTLDGIVNNFELLDNISAERIREELHKMFKFDTIIALKNLMYFSKEELSHIFNDRTGIWLKPTNES